MAHRWDSSVETAFDAAACGVLQVVGGPGTGKTSLLIDAAAARIAAGVDADSVLMLTGAGRVSAQARGALTASLLATRGPADVALPAVVGEPLVRTVHGYAFAVLQRAARRCEAAPPRLVTSAEQDSVIRELIAGDGPGAWPASLHAALATDGFATELRDLLARCAERGIDPDQLVRLGARHSRPEWKAAGRFAQQYEQIMLLRAAVGTAAPQATMPALGAAELVGAALEAFAADPDLLDDERARIRLLLVDDAQQLDPQAARLVRVLARGVQRTVIAGDPGQAVFGFRGGEPEALLGADATPTAATVTLSASHRCGPAVARAIGAISARWRGAGLVPPLDGTGADAGWVRAQTATSQHAEAALIADTLRRAHLVDGVPWGQMAVIVRSVPRAAAGLPRALSAAGIPVDLPAPAGLLADQPAVAALLTVLSCAADGLDGPRALTLLTGPIGRMDPVSLRQLQRTLRRRPGAVQAPGGAQEPLGTLVGLLNAQPTESPTGHARALHRVRAVLQAADRCHADGRDPQYTLWQTWQRSGLQQRWLAAADRGGPAGAQAGRDLDAVTALFDIAGQYVAHTAGASLHGLIEHVTAVQLVAPRADSAPVTDAVSVLSAHAALGREWDLVVIAGLQEGLWPNMIPRGGVLGTQRLLDVVDGIGEHASARAPVLAEERRLLVSAVGRARRRLLITAVDGAGESGGCDDQIPSPFFAELAACATGGGETAGRGVPVPVTAPPVLSVPAVVGRLRGIVCAPDGAVDDAERADAATQLARLARAGVPGADPAGWHGSTPVSTDEPLWRADDGQPVTLSPSSLQTLIDCPLRWLAERHGAADGRDLRSTIGSVLHTLVAQPGGSEAELSAELDRAWRQLPFEAQWYADNERERHRAMLAAFLQWRQQARGELTEVGVEVEFDGVVDGVRLRGRIDRVERDTADRLVVVDVKTAKSPATKGDAQQHAQLAMYQLAVDAGLIEDGGKPGGARLVYPGKPAATGATERGQDPLTDETRRTWLDRIGEAAAATAGPTFAARVNDGCRHCPIQPICPAHNRETS